MYEKTCWPSDILLEKVRFNMTVRSLYVYAENDCKVVIKDAAEHRVLFSGYFSDFPYKYADSCVSSFSAIGNALVIFIYN